MRKKQKDMKQVYDNAYIMIMKNLTQTATLWRRCLALVVMSLCGVAAFATVTATIPDDVYEAEPGDQVSLSFSGNDDPSQYESSGLGLGETTSGYVYFKEPINECKGDYKQEWRPVRWYYDTQDCLNSNPNSFFGNSKDKASTDKTKSFQIPEDYSKTSFEVYYGYWEYDWKGSLISSGPLYLKSKGDYNFPVYQGNFQLSSDKTTACPGETVTLTVKDNNHKNYLIFGVIRKDRGETLTPQITQPDKGTVTYTLTLPSDLTDGVKITAKGNRHNTNTIEINLPEFTFGELTVDAETADNCSYTLRDLTAEAKNLITGGCDVVVTQNPVAGTVYDNMTMGRTITVELTATDKAGRTLTQNVDVEVKVPDLEVEDFTVNGTPSALSLIHI